MDEQYIQQVLEGDINSFRFIVEKYRDMSFSISMSIVKSELLAEEAVQDAFVKAYQNLGKFRQQSKFSTWFYRIVLNESLRKVKKKALQVDNIENFIEESAIADNNSIEYLDKYEQQEIINRILFELPATESLLLRLYYLEENSIETISEITQLSQSNIKVILHRARKRFYAFLEKCLKHEMRTIL